MAMFALSANCLFVTTMPSYGYENGVSTSQLSIVIAATSTCSVVSKVLNGFIVDRKIFSALMHASLALLMCATAVLVAALIPGIVGNKLY